MNFRNFSFTTVTILLTLVYLILYIPLLNKVPTIMMDEPWYANTAYNFAEGNGFINTNVGYRGGDVFILYPLFMGIFFKILGCTLWTARFASLIGGLIALYGVIKIFQKLNINSFAILFGSLLFIVSNISFVTFKSARPEGLVLTFGIWAIYYLILFLDKPTKQISILLGIFSSFAFLMHPNGILFLINTGLVVGIQAIRNKAYQQALIFSTVCLVVLTIPFAYVFSDPKKWEEFLFHAQNRSSFSEKSGFISNLTTFFASYTLGIKRIFVLFFEMTILLFCLLFRKDSLIRLFAFLGLFNFVVSLLVFNPYVTRNFGQITIYSILCFTILLQHVRTNSTYSKIVTGLGLIYFLNNFAGDAYIIWKKSADISYNQISSELWEITGSNKQNKILTNIHFWFPFRENEFYCGQTNYNYQKYNDMDGLFSSGDLDYVITSDLLLRGTTGTSGRKEHISSKDMIFYKRTTDYSERNGTLIKEINGGIYGHIKVWKIKKE